MVGALRVGLLPSDRTYKWKPAIELLIVSRLKVAGVWGGLSWLSFEIRLRSEQPSTWLFKIVALYGGYCVVLSVRVCWERLIHSLLKHVSGIVVGMERILFLLLFVCWHAVDSCGPANQDHS